MPILAAGLLGAAGVALGAFGAHALKPALVERGMLEAWETASRYHLLHAVALFGTAGWLHGDPANPRSRILLATVWCWCAGVVLFSGSLYGLAIGGPRWLGPVTPLGGLALIAGWLLVAIAAFRKRP